MAVPPVVCVVAAPSMLMSALVGSSFYFVGLLLVPRGSLYPVAASGFTTSIAFGDMRTLL